MPTGTKHRVAIVADDLTSAADGSAPFVARGLAAIVGRGQPSATACDVLVVVGSANPCSHRQADRIEPMRGVTLVHAPAEREHDPAAVLHRIAANAAQLLLNGQFGTVIATGGDTMEAILDRLGIREFKVLHELEPGFPLGLAPWAGIGHSGLP
jgi:D-threonate/D-erythronate kinase